MNEAVKMNPFLQKHLRNLFLLSLLTALIFTAPRPAYADSVGLIIRGVARTLVSAFEIPKSMMEGSTQAFPLGLVAGTVAGSMKMVAGTLMGAVDIARGAAPYAKYAVLAGA